MAQIRPICSQKIPQLGGVCNSRNHGNTCLFAIIRAFAPALFFGAAFCISVFLGEMVRADVFESSVLSALTGGRDGASGSVAADNESLLFRGLAQANLSEEATSKIEMTSSEALSGETESKANVIGETKRNSLAVGVGSEDYLNRESPPSGVNHYTQVFADGRFALPSENFKGVLEIRGSLATDVENYSNIEVPEAYVGWERSASNEDSASAILAIGRRLETWSLLDQNWQLGMWQPLNRFDYIRPQSQGLTGAFVGYGGPRGKVILFISELFIPEQGASFTLENGKFQSRNPWFTEPANTLILFEEATDVVYHLDTPSVGSVINHPSAGLLLRYGQEPGNGEGFFAQSSFVRKPRNQLALPFEGYVQLTSSTTYVDVTVHPKVTYHSLAAIDLGYHSWLYSLGTSVLADWSEDPIVPSTLTYQSIKPVYLLSPYAEFRLVPSHYWGPRVHLAFLQTYGGEASTKGPLGSNQTVFSSPRIFHQAMSVSMSTTLYRRGSIQFDYGLRWIEEFAENGTLLQNDFRLGIGSAWTVALSADVLGSRRPLEETSTFLSRFRGNDRIFGRVKYVF